MKMLNLKDQTLLVIAPHPDDEVLGCSGLMKRVKDNGGTVFVLFMTVGDTKDYSAKGKSTLTQRVKEIQAVVKFLKLDGYEIALQGNDYHLRLDQVPQHDLIGLIEKYIKKVKPSILATVQSYDYNQDHNATSRAVLSATRPAPIADRDSPDIILGYRSVITAGWAEAYLPNHNLHLELSKADLAAKVRALTLYSSQIRENGHQRTPEAVEKIARILGIHAGTEYAESYFVHKFLTQA